MAGQANKTGPLAIIFKTPFPTKVTTFALLCVIREALTILSLFLVLLLLKTLPFMWQGLKEMITWFNREDENSSPEEASMANIVKLAALSAMATILERRFRENHDSDSGEEAPPPGAGK